MLLVAYPDQPDQPTEFEFKYWVGAYNGGFWERIGNLDFGGRNGELYVLAFVALILFGIYTLITICYFLNKCR